MAKKHNPKKRHKVWQLQEAKARFSELVHEVEHDGYHTITRHGQPVAIVMSIEEFERLSAPKRTLLDIFRDAPLEGLDLKRDKDLGRDVEL